MRQLITYSRRIVIKLGTGLLTRPDGQIDNIIIEQLVRQITALHREGREVLLVSSGAIGAGFPLLNLSARPTTLPLLQASAAAGQTKLMRLYDDLFGKQQIMIAQVLLTRDDLKIRKRHLNIRNTLNTLLQNKVLPIINENDTVSVDEIRFGDNDLLSALVTNLIQADLLINLTNVDGLLEKSPDGQILHDKIIHEVKGLPSSIFRHTSSEKSKLGSGGIAAKLKAAKVLTTSGEFMIIANGRDENILQNVLSGKTVGTLFTPEKGKMESRKRWIAFFHQSRGTVIVDHGARNALLNKGKSLLPSGIIEVDGTFKTGDIVMICDRNREEIGKGLINFSSDELHRIKGCHTSMIESIIGHSSYDEVIHRNNLVITYTEPEG